MSKKATNTLQENIKNVSSVEEAQKEIRKNQGIISFSWCGESSCGKEMEEILRVDLLGVQEESPEEKECINCGEPAKKITLLAKTY